MLNKALTSFNHNKEADLAERVGNFGLALWRIGFGETVQVETIKNLDDKVAIRRKIFSLSAKVSAAAVCIFALPITLLLAGVGFIGTRLSKTHHNLYDKYTKKREVQDQAATKIQKHIRGHLARKPHLPLQSFHKYKEACEQVKAQPDLMPRAEGGKTEVFLPNEVPETVLKKSGRQEAVKRFHQMQEVRAILNSQNSTHLVIPKANLYDNFLVEEKLPIVSNNFYNMSLYLSQPELFDDAVREMTRLFSKIYLTDLVGNQTHPLGHIPDVENYVRYDNIPLYIEEKNGQKEGKIGLIDLEHLENKPSINALETLARIFPLHLDVIIDEARKLKIEIYDESVKEESEKGKKYLKVGFSDHLNWINQRVKSKLISDLQPLNIGLNRIDELTSLLKIELFKLNQGINDLYKMKGDLKTPDQNFLLNPEETASELAEKIAPLIVKHINIQLEEQRADYLKQFSKNELTDAELVRMRSPLIHRPKIHIEILKLLLKLENPENKINFLNLKESEDFAEQLVCVSLAALEKTGDIFLFDPAFYTDKDERNLCWIRY